jgi:hypothetical protein
MPEYFILPQLVEEDKDFQQDFAPFFKLLE